MKLLMALLCWGTLSAVTTASAEPVASVVAVRGKATIERGAKKLDAQPKLGIELQDTVSTAEGARAKLLFIDDSVLTLAEKSRMNVDTFIHSRSDRGKSLFNLIDGKMRAVVGKTRFEVKTPTVVAAARGTVILFDTSILDGEPFTRVTCLEGIVELRSLTDTIGAAPVMLSPSHSVVVKSGQPLPKPTQLTPAELEKLKQDTNTSGSEIKMPDMTSLKAINGLVGVTPIPIPPPFDRQQPVTKPQPTNVNIGVKF
jgi:ferric-dicitrate binding protein FerR (iron transport regulator)